MIQINKMCSAFQEVSQDSGDDPPNVVRWCAELEPETTVFSLPLALVSILLEFFSSSAQRKSSSAAPSDRRSGDKNHLQSFGWNLIA